MTLYQLGEFTDEHGHRALYSADDMVPHFRECAPGEEGDCGRIVYISWKNLNPFEPVNQNLYFEFMEGAERIPDTFFALHFVENDVSYYVVLPLRPMMKISNLVKNLVIDCQGLNRSEIPVCVGGEWRRESIGCIEMGVGGLFPYEVLNVAGPVRQGPNLVRFMDSWTLAAVLEMACYADAYVDAPPPVILPKDNPKRYMWHKISPRDWAFFTLGKDTAHDCERALFLAFTAIYFGAEALEVLALRRLGQLFDAETLPEIVAMFTGSTPEEIEVMATAFDEGRLQAGNEAEAALLALVAEDIKDPYPVAELPPEVNVEVHVDAEGNVELR